MFEGPLPRPLNHRTTRVAAGLGMIPRVAASGEGMYGGRVAGDEIERRLEACWRPYHAALSMLVEQTYSLFGGALLLDAHSMPSSASGIGPRERDQRIDVVLGDNHGEACAASLIDCAERWLVARGLRVRRNQPYAGGFTTPRYRPPSPPPPPPPIQPNRAPHIDEARDEKLPGFAATQALMTGLLEEIGQAALETLLPRPLAAE